MGQHACRPGTQAIEAVSCAQSALRIFKQTTGRQRFVCKRDTTQAFDTVSRHAIWRYLQDTQPSPEALALWNMRQDTKICLQLGSRMWVQELQKGVAPAGTLRLSTLRTAWSSTRVFQTTGSFPRRVQRERPAAELVRAGFYVPMMLRWLDFMLHDRPDKTCPSATTSELL